MEVCASNHTNAVNACESVASQEQISYTSMDAQTTVCSIPPSLTCTGWDPSNHIAFNAGTYEIDAQFVNALIADPSPLLQCESGLFYFDESAGSHFVLNGTTTGDLYGLIGLEEDDKPLSIDGIALDDWDGVAEAFFLVLNGETELTMVVERDSSPVTLFYEIVP